MELEDYITNLPLPATIQRGTPKRQWTLHLTEQEDDIVQHLAETLPSIFNRQKKEVIRAALGMFIWELETMVNAGWKPTIQQIKDMIRHTNYLQSKEAIADLLDHKADMLNVLIDFGEFDGAMEEFDKYLDEVHQLPKWWVSIVENMQHEHPGMERFFTRVDRMGLEAQIQLKGLMDKKR